jgi:ribosomal protein L40E
MKTSTLGLALGIAGVGVILTPVVLFMVSGYGSPVQKFLDSQFVQGLPMGIVLSAGGAAVSALGVLLFIKGMRSVGATPPLTMVSRPSRPLPQQPSQATDDLEIEIERLIKDELEPRVEVRTPQPRHQSKTGMGSRPPTQQVMEQPQQTHRAVPAVEVVSRGFDMVCKSCGAVNPLEQTTCGECGGRLFEPNPKLPACPVCGAPLEGEHRVGERVVCTVCFSELKLQKA